MPTLSQLYYYPVKGLQGVALNRIAASAGERLPFDRRYAIGDQTTAFDPANPCHIKKQNLVVQMKHEKLAALAIGFEPATATLTVAERNTSHRFALESPDGHDAFERFMSDYLGEAIQGPARLISAPGLAFTDLSHQSVSLINLNSVMALQDALGYPIDPRRFRANLYLDGVPAWEEETWLGKTLEISGVRIRIYRITDRCAAINVDPQNARRDKTLQGLKKAFGHLNMGVYGMIESNGELVAGSEFEQP